MQKKISVHHDLGQINHFSDITLSTEDTEKAFQKTVQQKSSPKHPVKLRFWIFPPLARYLAVVNKSEITAWIIWSKVIFKVQTYYFYVLCFSKKLGACIQTNHLTAGSSTSWHQFGSCMCGGHIRMLDSYIQTVRKLFYLLIFFFYVSTRTHIYCLNLQ